MDKDGKGVPLMRPELSHRVRTFLKRVELYPLLVPGFLSWKEIVPLHMNLPYENNSP